MKKECVNRIDFTLPALSVNEGVARSLVGSAVSLLDPTLEELADIKCSVSEAVTNAIVHGYGGAGGMVYISVKLYADRSVQIEVRDKGCGIADVEEARRPLFTTDETGERSGMGFTVMETFMDALSVSSGAKRGTRVVMTKRLSYHGDARKI